MCQEAFGPLSLKFEIIGLLPLLQVSLGLRRVQLIYDEDWRGCGAGLTAAAPYPGRFAAGGGGEGDNGHSETTYLSNCLFYYENYSVALSMNSQREGAAGGSWRLSFNQMSTQGLRALWRGGRVLWQGFLAWSARGRPQTPWTRQLGKRRQARGLGRGKDNSETAGKARNGMQFCELTSQTYVQSTSWSPLCYAHFHQSRHR